MNMIEIYDTTLRDGVQGESISFSLDEKIKICQRLDNIGIDFIEGGWPGSNPKDVAFFKEIKKKRLKNSKIVAFGSTRRAKNSAGKDKNLNALLSAKTEIVTIFGKSWGLHAREVLRISLEKNLEIIEDSIKYLKRNNCRVFFDAEHFFDGYKNNPDYALRTILVAQEAGAERIILCDTNGGVLPEELQNIIREVRNKIKIPLGIHTHNDSGMAVANSILAVVSGGVIQVQGTINGFGERCGNADLCIILPILKLKLGKKVLAKEQLKNLTGLSRYVNELANLIPQNNQPFVGRSAFAHKGGVHVDAISKTPRSYEHIDPTLVGNKRRILISELSGKSNILYKLEKFGIKQPKEKVKEMVQLLGTLEKEGYQFEAADASFNLLARKVSKGYKGFFELLGFRVIVERKNGRIISEATVKLRVKDETAYTVAEGDGPVDALDIALLKGLEKFYPVLSDLRLIDYKVRVLNPEAGTAAKVRVLVQSSDKKESWGTVGLSENIIEASLQALIDSIEYKLWKSKGTI